MSYKGVFDSVWDPKTVINKKKKKKKKQEAHNAIRYRILFFENIIETH